MDAHGPPVYRAPQYAIDPPRTGAFAGVHARWLPLCVLAGWLVVTGADLLASEVFGVTLSGEAYGILIYAVVVAWVWVTVVRRGGVNLAVMLRWPRLGTYWFVVAGLLLLQFIFSLAAILLTELVFPGLSESVDDVGQGNLVLAALGLVVLPPLVEELVFRGVLIERFTVKWRVGVAVLVSSVLFGVLHVDPVGAGMFGVVTGLLYLRTGSLWPGILIHAGNNLVALIAIQLSDPSAVEPPPPTVAETLVAAGGLLAVSVPFLAWFIVRTWPTRRTPTPYQRHELEHGLPSRSIAGVEWSGTPGLLTLRVTGTDATLTDTSGGELAVLPLRRVAAVYPSASPSGQQVVVLLLDGSWTTLRRPPGAVRPTLDLALTLRERAALGGVQEPRVRRLQPPRSVQGPVVRP